MYQKYSDEIKKLPSNKYISNNIRLPLNKLNDKI
jgi:hypothetical protein